MNFEQQLQSLSNWLQHALRSIGDRLPEAEAWALQQAPVVERFLIKFADILFSPRELIKQIALINLLQLAMMATQVTSKLARMWFSYFTKIGRKVRQIEEKMSEARTYHEWKSYAEDLDRARGLKKWRSQDESKLYDSQILKKRIREIREMVKSKDIFNLMFRLRGGLSRDQFGVQNDGLYSLCAAGTKHIVEDYHSTIIEALICIAETDDCVEDIPTDAKLAFFNEVRHSFGRTALLLSGGAALGYYHIGLARCLFLEGLLPRVISGASAGSIMAAIIGTRTDEQMMDMIDVANFRKDFFRMKKNQNIISKFQYMLPQSLRWISENILGLIFNKHSLLKMDTDHLVKVMIENVGHDTFQEAFDRTGRIINITVAPVNAYEPPRLLNYLTAPHVCVWSATVASCAIPGVFDSVNLIVKEPDGEFRPENEWTRHSLAPGGSRRSAVSKGFSGYSDGSVENDLPMMQLAELFNVNHFVVSQVNAHSAVLSTLSLQASIWSNPIYGAVTGYLRFLKAMLRDWLRNFIDMVVYKRMTPSFFGRRGLHQILTQEYEGREKDVTILPWRGHLSIVGAFMNLIRNPTEPEYAEIVNVGQRNTWPFVARIRAHCGVEMTLDRLVQALRKKLLLENQSSEAAPDEAGRRMGRAPSFYTSRSIVNLSGLGILDPSPLGRKWNNPSPGDLDWVEAEDALGPDVLGESVPLAEDAGTEPRQRRDSVNDSSAVPLMSLPGLMKSTSMANFYYKKSHSEERLNGNWKSTERS